MSMSTSAEDRNTKDEAGMMPGGSPSIRWIYLLCALWLSVHLPLTVVHLTQLWKLPHYQFFPLLIVGCAFLAWRVWPASGRGGPVLTRVGYAGAAIAFAVQILAAIIYSPWLSMVAMLISLAAMGCILFDRSGLRALLPIWLLLWLLVPLPFGGDRILVQELQTVTSQFASAVVDLLGINHLLAGNVIELPGHKLFVDEACSGVNTVFALLAVAGLYACYAHRSWIIAIPLIASAAFWAGLVNVVRVVVIVVALDYFSVDLAEGLPHTVLSLVLLPATLLFLLGTNHFLMTLFGPIHRDGQEQVRLPSLAKTWNRFFGWCEEPLDVEDGVWSPEPAPLGGSPANGVVAPRWWSRAATLSLVLCLLQVGFLSRAVATIPTRLAFQQLDERLLSSAANGWKLDSFETEQRKSGDDFGEHSLIWRYTTSDDCGAAASFDFPFVNWHELTNCYENSGWTVVNRETQHPGDGQSPLVVAELEKPTGERGVLVFSLFDREGNDVPPPDSFGNQLRNRAGNILTYYQVSSETYQFQLFLEVPPHVSKRGKQDVISRFTELRERVRSAGRTGS
jgi:exosortase